MLTLVAAHFILGSCIHGSYLVETIGMVCLRLSASTRTNPYSAALTMYQRARKLQSQINDPSTLFALAEEQIEAYLQAINSLSLVDPKSAWVALPVQQDHGHEVCPLLTLLNGISLNPPQPRKRRKLSKYIPETSYSSSKDDAEIVGLADMQYEYALLSARLDLARKDKSLINTGGKSCTTFSADGSG
jgi:hypothetical protein